MVKKKTQKVRFHKGDKRPGGGLESKLTYSVEMAKEGRKILWHVVEQPTNNIVGKYFFEDDAMVLADFQNKNKVWQVNGGIPKFLWNWVAGSYE
jgi:hypothetical protein|tara:strand:- start:1588 stop:1869 length:282 start_codon:yes stop_codon:yes gene_type:complete